MKKLIETLRLWITSLRKTKDDFLDVFSPKNQVKITIKDLNGNPIRVITGRNIVTGYINGTLVDVSGRDFLRRCIINPSITSKTLSGRYISYMKLGTGSDAETVNDTDLDQEITPDTTKYISTNVSLSTTDPDVTFTASWGSSDANGSSISEVALYSDQGDFIARKTFSSFSKTSAFTFDVEWTLRF